MALYNLLLRLLLPSGLGVVLLLAALLLRSRKRLSTGLVIGAALVLLFFGNRWAVDWLARPLEWRHLPASPLPRADVIVSLGGGTLPPERPRPTVEVSEDGDRVIYAAHLLKEGKADFILCTGGMVPGTDRDHAGSHDIADLLRMMGVPASAIVEQPLSRNTFEDALYARPILKERKVKRLLLVTSAAHMPRSLAVFRKQCPDLEIIPAPTDFTVTQRERRSLWEIARGCVPSGHELERADAVLHEYIGLAYYRLRGWI
ncbi:MAG: YdcF family protein [Verrucomicrobia bacterium]|nr:YdcF family protein [Verrucomicrobiota bacterium]